MEKVGEELEVEFEPIEEVQELPRVINTLTKKWTVHLYLLYATRGYGFSQPCRLLMGISSRTLSLRLKSLEGMGWVRRRVLEERSPRVVYSLTDTGMKAAKLAEPMVLYTSIPRGRRRRGRELRDKWISLRRPTGAPASSGPSRRSERSRSSTSSSGLGSSDSRGCVSSSWTPAAGPCPCG